MLWFNAGNTFASHKVFFVIGWTVEFDVEVYASQLVRLLSF